MIREIVEKILTYEELTERARAAIFTVLIPQLEKENICSEQIIYERVTEWIDKRKKPYPERYAIELDAPYPDGTPRLFADPRVQDPSNVFDSAYQCLTYEHLRPVLKEKISSSLLAIVDHVIGEDTHVPLDDLLLDIEARVEQKLRIIRDERMSEPTPRIISVPHTTLMYRRGFSPEKLDQVRALLETGAGTRLISNLTGISRARVIKLKSELFFSLTTKPQSHTISQPYYTPQCIEPAIQQTNLVEMTTFLEQALPFFKRRFFCAYRACEPRHVHSWLAPKYSLKQIHTFLKTSITAGILTQAFCQNGRLGYYYDQKSHEKSKRIQKFIQDIGGSISFDEFLHTSFAKKSQQKRSKNSAHYCLKKAVQLNYIRQEFNELKYFYYA